LLLGCMVVDEAESLGVEVEGRFKQQPVDRVGRRVPVLGP
jgi:hypothetical protein